jgi:hypothetical protein
VLRDCLLDLFKSVEDLPFFYVLSWDLMLWFVSERSWP